MAGDKEVRACRFDLAGSAMAFEHGWLAVHQMLSAKPRGDVRAGPRRGAQSPYPFQRASTYQPDPPQR